MYLHVIIYLGRWPCLPACRQAGEEERRDADLDKGGTIDASELKQALQKNGKEVRTAATWP